MLQRHRGRIVPAGVLGAEVSHQAGDSPGVKGHPSGHLARRGNGQVRSVHRVGAGNGDPLPVSGPDIELDGLAGVIDLDVVVKGFRGDNGPGIGVHVGIEGAEGAAVGGEQGLLGVRGEHVPGPVAGQPGFLGVLTDIFNLGFRGVDCDLTRIAGRVAEQRIAVGAVHLQGVEIGVA